MEIKQIKELMAAMTRCGTTKLQIKDGDFELQLERSNGEMAYQPPSLDELEAHHTRFAHQPPHSNAPLPRSTEKTLTLHSQDDKVQESGTFITSPMVGTYYSSPSPEDPPFLKAGQKIEKGDVVCIVEAMKVMNEIKAQVSGTILEMLVENGSPVEFGTKLFRVE